MLTSSQLPDMATTQSTPSRCLQERKWWQALSALLAGQPLLSLSLCPGLVCALAEAGQYALIPLVAAQVKAPVRIMFGWAGQSLASALASHLLPAPITSMIPALLKLETWLLSVSQLPCHDCLLCNALQKVAPLAAASDT